MHQMDTRRLRTQRKEDFLMANTKEAFAIPCQIIIEAYDREQAEKMLLTLLKGLFDDQWASNGSMIGFDTAEELRDPERDIS